MKKVRLVLLFLIAIAQTSYAQINWSDYSQSFPDGAMDKVSTIAIITAIRSANDSFWDSNNGQLFNIIGKDTLFQNLRPKSIVAITTFDTAHVQFFLHGVDQNNAREFEYRVTEYKGKILVPWTTVNQFTNKAVIESSGIPQMGYLGGYIAALGKIIVIDVKKQGSNRIIASSVVKWKAIKPFLQNIYTSNELNTFLNRLSRPYEADRSNSPKDKYSAHQVDPITGLPKKLKVESYENSLVFFLKGTIYHKEQIQYELFKNNEVSIPWKVNDFDNSFIWLKDLSPGEYLLKIRFPVQPSHLTEFNFEVAAAWYQSILFKIIAVILIIAFFSAFVFLLLLIKQRQKTQTELSNKTKVQLELKSIYAQLNPHFVFNALSSIQGLINKQDIKGANNYLSDFARLMRESLNNNNKEEISLNEEKLLLTTYLRLEQLRFGFQYQININKSINSYETSIPSLLLQPLIENAVKHGVSALQEKGLVSIEVTKFDDTMIVTISDNGNGFTSNNTTSGFGLKLTRDRIKLLNELNKGQNILLEIKESSTLGTTVKLTFKNWFQ